jgi:hypothetical protein
MGTIRRFLTAGTAVAAAFVIVTGQAAAATPSGFEPVASPTIPRGNLCGVDATGPSDAWAVGRFSAPDTGHPRMLVEHWNGKAWSRVTLPSAWAGKDAWLFDVLALSPTDVWAAGYIGPLGMEHALIIHRSASGWTKYTLTHVPTDVGDGQSILYGLGGSAHNNLWAVGLLGEKDPLVLHFTGTSWAYLPAPSPGANLGNPLNAVRVVGPSNVWFVGSSEVDGGTYFQGNPYALHWNGSSFGSLQYLTQPFPQPPNSVSYANDLDVVGTSPIAVGFGLDASNVGQGVIWRRGSDLWNPFTPFADATRHVLNSVQVIGSSNIWTVGQRTSTMGEQRTWIVHWNGSSWASLGGPNPQPGDSDLHGVSSVPGATTLWAVGETGFSQTDDTSGTPLILRRN